MRPTIAIISLLLCLSSTVALAQTEQKGWVNRTLNRFFNDTTSASEKSFRVYPTLGYSPETGIEIGASGLWLFRAKGDSTNRLSEVQAFTFFTFKAQYGLWIDNAIYGDQDKWFFLGRTRIQRFPLLYYGIGPDTDGEHPAVVDANYILLRQRVLRKISRNLFLGPEIDYQYLYGTEFNQPEEGPKYTIPSGGNGTSNLGFGAALVYDDRHNVLNVRKGWFGELSYLGYHPSLTSDFKFGSINLDIRGFHPYKKNNVIAWQVLGNFLNGNVPFNQLALMGGDMMMRGYYQGRYRDKNMLAAQVEYRMLPFSFSKRWGATVFAGTAAVAPEVKAFQLDKTQFAGGAGVRYLLFPKKDIFLRLDVGMTREGPGFYFFTGEAF
ncbi:BamA/TamA family outer membrane protein [Chitinophaga rhizophila]|uniref:Outer membrane protein assembly factor n=1 Tax=Chitinophaga rhizophila TaxID=2866212 RepID=A0ABS7GJ81_9BACT|nr:BamA/TamA family outer membrane protein [Chitinophaga rhizophila]MBW8687757.1 outer membrane protein assembly factor [Chitinophaga rhizophila]